MLVLQYLPFYVATCNSLQTRYAHITSKLAWNSSLGEKTPAEEKDRSLTWKKKKEKLLLDIKLLYYVIYSIHALIKYWSTDIDVIFIFISTQFSKYLKKNAIYRK